jgi:uncharacterized protein
VIIADTGPLVAVANDQDKHHSTCKALLENYPGPVLVPTLVVLEVCQVLASRRGTRSEASFLGSVAAGELRLIDLTSADYARCAELVTRYSNLPLGAADASVVAVAERLGIAEVATLDRRHFSVAGPEPLSPRTGLPLSALCLLRGGLGGGRFVRSAGELVADGLGLVGTPETGEYVGECVQRCEMCLGECGRLLLAD